MKTLGKLHRLPAAMELCRTTARICRSEKGTSAIEYSLMAGLIALAIVFGISSLGTSVNRMFSSVATAMR